jgi:1-acyl-sn-glycerol-3-phosphate acyltransferase
MQENSMEKTVYYTDELTDDFSGMTPKNLFIPASYPYIHKNIFYRLCSFVAYRLILTPIAFGHKVFGLHQKIVNKSVLKPYAHQGYFLFGNHTNQLGGGFTPSMVCFPKKVYLLVNSDNVAVKGLSTLFKMGGALPLPSTLEGMIPFMNAIEKRLDQGCAIGIYPEAHIWPYCTTIRPFKPVSFKYAVKYDVPVFCFTDCYKQRRFSKKPRTVTYVDGPFFVNKALPVGEQHVDLRNQVYEAMVARASRESTYAVIRYVKKEAPHD